MVINMGTSKSRIERLNEILTTLKKNEGEATFGELYGHFAVSYGTTKRTFWSYLEVLKIAGKIDYPDIIVSAKEDETRIVLEGGSVVG